MAIRENTELLQEIIDKMDYMVRVMDSNHKVIYMNKKMKKVFPKELGEYCYDLVNQGKRCKHCIATGAKYTGQSDSKDLWIKDKYYRVISSPINMESNRNYSIELFQDVTDEKRMEMELLNHYEKLKDDIGFAKHIQHQALPEDKVYWNAYKTDSLYIQSEDLGGDLFDIVKLTEDKSLIYISDVSGHGVKSSLLTIFLRQVIRGARENHKEINSLLDELVKSYNDLNVGDEQYLTILAGIYDRNSKEITFANGGHNCYPIWIKNDQTVKEIYVEGMPICSLLKKAAYHTVTMKMEKGDKIIFYTDGISEAYNENVRKEFGSEGIIKLLKEHVSEDGRVLARKVIEGAKTFREKALLDDMAILVIEFL